MSNNLGGRERGGIKDSIGGVGPWRGALASGAFTNKIFFYIINCLHCLQLIQSANAIFTLHTPRSPRHRVAFAARLRSRTSRAIGKRHSDPRRDDACRVSQDVPARPRG